MRRKCCNFLHGHIPCKCLGVMRLLTHTEAVFVQIITHSNLEVDWIPRTDENAPKTFCQSADFYLFCGKKLGNEWRPFKECSKNVVKFILKFLTICSSKIENEILHQQGYKFRNAYRYNTGTSERARTKNCQLSKITLGWNPGGKTNFLQQNEPYRYQSIANIIS